MAARAAIALSLAALAWTASARAGDDPACAQYHDDMSYNSCLASHGPKANNLGRLHGATPPGGGAHDRGRVGGAPRTGAQAARFSYGQRPQRVRGRMHMEFQVR
jgi:hypothetical protein